MAFLCLACDGPASAEGDFSPTLVWDSGTLVSLLSEVGEC